MNAAKAKFAKNQIVQKFGLAQLRIGWRRGDCMNRLVCRRRIGVIHLHRDDRCCPLSDIYSLSRARLTRERPAKAIPSIISDRQILSPASQYDVGTSLSFATNVNVTAASVSPTLRLCSWQPQWFGETWGLWGFGETHGVCLHLQQGSWGRTSEASWSILPKGYIFHLSG